MLISKLNNFFPGPLCWTFEEVSEIERERSGKTRFCISYVKRQAGGAPMKNEGERQWL
jgi:hypothetical protein